MENRKVFITRWIKHSDDLDFCDQAEGARIRRLITQPECVTVIMVSEDIQLTVGQVHYLERMFRTMLKEPVSVIY